MDADRLAGLEKRGPIWACGILAALLVAFFAKIFFAGQTFESFDQIAYEAHLPFLRAAFQGAGSFFDRFPLWNPYVFAGMPGYASLLAAPYTNPLALGLGFIPEIFRVILYYLSLGLSSWYLLRRFRLGVLPALLGAVVCVFATQIITMVMFGQMVKITTLQFVPLFLALTDKIWEEGKVRPALLLALVTGLMLLIGHFQIAFYALSAGALYLAVGSLFRRSEGLDTRALVRRWALWAGALVLGLVASAALTLPVHEYSASSIRGTATGVGYSYATNFSLHPLETVTLLVPSFFGYAHSMYWGWMVLTDFPFYFGIIPLFLAVLTLVVWPKERRHVYLAVLIGFALLLSFGKYLPLLYGPFFAFVPFFNKFRVPSMAMVLVALGVAALAAIGVQRLASPPPADAERLRRNFMRLAQVFLGLLVVLAVLLGLGVFKDAARARRLHVAQEHEQANLLLPTLAPPTPAMQDAAKAQAEAATGRATADAVVTLLFFAAGAALVALRLRGSVSREVMVVGLLVVTAGDLFRVAAPALDYTPRLDPPQPFQSGRGYTAAQFLKGEPGQFRILPMTPEGVGGNWYAWFELQSLLGYHPAKLGLYQDLMDDDGPVGLRKMLALGNYNVINMLNAQYIVAPQQIDDPNFETLVTEPYYVMRNNGALPRMWFVDRARTIPDPAEQLKTIADPAWKPREEALVFANVGALDPGRAATAALLSYRPREIRARLFAPGNSLLMISEMYYQPGWTATLDGRPTEILRADYALRAVRVAPGTHELVMKFRSVAFETGVWITLATFILLGLALLATFRLDRRGGAAGAAVRP